MWQIQPHGIIQPRAENNDGERKPTLLTAVQKVLLVLAGAVVVTGLIVFGVHFLDVPTVVTVWAGILSFLATTAIGLVLVFRNMLLWIGAATLTGLSAGASWFGEGFTLELEAQDSIYLRIVTGATHPSVAIVLALVALVVLMIGFLRPIIYFYMENTLKARTVGQRPPADPSPTSITYIEKQTVYINPESEHSKEVPSVSEPVVDELLGQTDVSDVRNHDDIEPLADQDEYASTRKSLSELQRYMNSIKSMLPREAVDALISSHCGNIKIALSDLRYKEANHISSQLEDLVSKYEYFASPLIVKEAYLVLARVATTMVNKGISSDRERDIFRAREYLKRAKGIDDG